MNKQREKINFNKNWKQGYLPKGWMVRKIGNLCTFSSGHGFNKKDWSSSGYPIIRIQNLNGNSQFNYFSGKPDPTWIVMLGDILFAWAGVKGVSFGPTVWNGPKGVLNQHIYKVHPIEEVDPHWLFLSLVSVTQEIERKAHGFKSSLLHVHKKEITGQEILFPPIVEQKKIAKILSIWDTAIVQSRKLISAKRDQRKALMQQLLMGKVRLPGFMIKKSREAYRFFDLPNDWECPKLRELAQEHSLRNKGNGEATVLSCSKGSRKNNFAELVLGFGSGLVDPREQNHRNSVLFRGF